MLCPIWYHLYNLKNVKNTHGRVLPLSKVAGFSLTYTLDLDTRLIFKN